MEFKIGKIYYSKDNDMIFKITGRKDSYGWTPYICLNIPDYTINPRFHETSSIRFSISYNSFNINNDFNRFLGTP